MAARDIMPWRAPLGGTTKVETYHLLAAQTFLEGEVVRLDSGTGQLEEAATNPDLTVHIDGGTVGVACDPAEGMATDAAGTTNAAFARRGAWIFTMDQEFITPNFSVAGTAFNDADFLHIRTGQAVGLLRVAGPPIQWGIALATVTNLQFRVTSIMDARRQEILDLTTDATWVAFRRETAYLGVPQ